MPVLPPEPHVFPDDLLESPALQTDTRWWVLHTRPRAEKALVRRLLPHAVSFFLPQYEQRRQSKGRLLTSLLPLFPGYVFIHTDAEGRHRALETNCVATCIPVIDQARLRADLERVYRLVTSGSPVGPEERLQPGLRVEITHGCLSGMQGTILRRGDQLTFYVEVELIRRGVSVPVQSWMIRPVGPCAPMPAA